MATLRRLRVLVPLVAALLVAGCMHVNRALLVNADGTGSYTLTIGFRELVPNVPSSIAQSTIAAMNTFATIVQQTGGTYHQYGDQGYEYWTFIRPFSSVAQADALLQEDPRPYDQAHTPVLYHDSLHITRQAGPSTTQLQVTGELSLADPMGTSTSWKDATESLAITMPGGITSYEGGTREGQTVTYTIGYNQSATIDVAGNVAATGNAAATGSTGLAAARIPVALLLALLAVVLFALGLRMLRTPAKR